MSERLLRAAASPKRLTFPLLAAYALPGLPLAALTLPLYIVVPNFYASELGLSLTVIGGVLFAIRVFDGVIDPFLGYACDRYDPGLGRRRSWVLAAMPVSVLATWMIFVPPGDAGPLYLFGWGIVFSLSLSAFQLSYTAWGAELATGYEERNRVAAVREVAILIGTLVATATPALTISLTDGGNAEALYFIALFVAIGLPLTTFLAFFQVPEPVDRSKRRVAFKAGLRALVRNKPFVRLIISFVFNGLANALPATLFLFFVTDRLQAEDARGILLLTYFLCGLIGVPLWLKVAHHYGKHRTWCFAMVIACVVFAFAPLLGPGDVWLFGLITVITGLVLGADLVLPSSIQADVIDVDTAETGEQRSGVYFAAWSVATQLSLAAAVGLAFPILDMAGFDAENSGSLAADAPGLFTLAALYGWLPIAFKLIAIALMVRFPLDRTMHDELERKIAAS
ncbi:MAG: MFS transporter [Pseudomonadota bacterium]